MRLKISVLNLLLFTMIVALGIGWLMDHAELKSKNLKLEEAAQVLKDRVETLDAQQASSLASYQVMISGKEEYCAKLEAESLDYRCKWLAARRELRKLQWSELP